MNNHNSNNEGVELGQFDDDYRNAQPETTRGDFEEVPDGKYEVAVEKVGLTTSSTGRPMLKWALRILGPHHANRLLWRNQVFTQNTIKYIKLDLSLCGLELENLSDLANHLVQLLDLKLEITKRSKGEYQNIYFNARIETNREPPRNLGPGLAAF